MLFRDIINLYYDIKIQIASYVLNFKKKNFNFYAWFHRFRKKPSHNFSNADGGFEVFINDHFVFDDNDGQYKTTVKVKVS